MQSNKGPLCVALLLIGTLCTAQNRTNLDSLLRQLPLQKEDTLKVQQYIDIGYVYESDDPQTAARYYRLAGALSRKLNYKRGIIKYVSNYTGLLNQKAEFDSSLVLSKEAVELAKGLKDKLVLAKCYANTGNLYQYLHDYENALQYYETAKVYFDELGNPSFTAHLCDLMQNTYRHLNQPEKALQFGNEAVTILRKQGDSVALGMALTNLGNGYDNAQSDRALKCYTEAIGIFRSQNFKRGEMICLLGVGNIYLHRYDADNMKPCYEKAMQLAQQLEEPENESVADRGMAHYYLYKKKFGEARNYIDRALRITDSLGLNYEHQSNLKSLCAILFAQQDIVGAEKALDSAGAIEAKLNGDIVTDKTLALSKKFETERKDAQIRLQQAQLRQKSVLNYFLIGGAVGLLVILTLVYRNYKNRQELQQQKITELETEKRLTATEAVLKGEEQERTRLAKDLHDGLGGLLSGIKYSLSNMKQNLIMTPDNAQAFERSIDMLDSSIKEMRSVAHNLMPEVLVKYGLDTALKEYCDELDRSGVMQVNYHSMDAGKVAISQTTEITIYRIVQELVNNTMKHAGAKNVLVQLHASVQENTLSVTVEDDGKGFDTASLNRAAGMGWSNIRNRVEFLKGTIDIKSTDKKGTSVLIEINTSPTA